MMEGGIIDAGDIQKAIEEAMDRVGLLRDLSTISADEKVNMQAVSTQEHPDQSVSVSITLETTGVEQLSRLLAKMEGIHGIFSVAREVESSREKV